MTFSTLFAQRPSAVFAVAHRHTFPIGFTWSTQALITLAAGILILIRPRWLNFIVALYLIYVGIVGLVHLRW